MKPDMKPAPGSPEGMKARMATAMNRDMGVEEQDEPEAVQEKSPEAEKAEAALDVAVKNAMAAGLDPEYISEYVEKCCGGEME